MTPSTLEIDDLAVSFAGGGRRIRAVDGLGLTVHPRQTLALVGESGCGKSVTALTILGLVRCPPGRIERGSIRWRGRSLLRLPPRALRRIRGAEIAMVFQEPTAALNPVFTIGEQLVEALRLHQGVGRSEARGIARRTLDEVGIRDSARCLRAYPHQLSGGMCQRAMIAMAISGRPGLLLADEPTTALDVTIQAQVLDLLAAIQRERGMGMMLITHDLGVVAAAADVVCVMYAGRVVEYADVRTLFGEPLHPYTRALLRSIPRLREPRDRLPTVADALAGDLAWDVPDAVPWWPRGSAPAAAALVEVADGHWVACREPAGISSRGRPDLAFRRDEPAPTAAGS